jgi:4-alpha-glucanotransferase
VIFPRCSGILLHVTSLPGSHGIGDLGRSAHDFVEFLAESGQKLWQVLPLSPTGYGDSPYQCFSAFAGNPLLIDLTALREQGLLSLQDLTNVPDLPDGRVEFGRVIAFKQSLLRKAAHTFLADGDSTDRGAFDIFCQDNAVWLDDYALFMACKAVHKDAVWANWDPGIRRRDSAALNQWQQKLSPETEVHKFAQFEFFRQWEKLKTHSNRRGLKIMGDITI